MWAIIDMNRCRGYENETSHSIIKEFSISSYSDGIYLVMVEARSDEHFSILKAALTERFPWSCFHNYFDIFMQCNLRSNLLLTSAFIQILKKIEPSFTEIEHDIIDTFHFNLSQDIIIPRWITLGNFQTRESSTSGYYHLVTYASSCVALSELAMSALSDSSSCTIRLVSPTREQYLNLIQAIVSSGFPRPDSNDRDILTYRITFNATNRHWLSTSFLNTIGALCDLSEILDNINANLDLAIPHSRREVVTQDSNRFGRLPSLLSSSASMFSSESISSSRPDIGANAQKLEASNYQEVIPEEYQCSLTNHVMTDPVYDPAHPNIKFERAAIRHALERKQENPFTRTLLTKDELFTDLELKKRIDEFVENTVNASKSQTFKKL